MRVGVRKFACLPHMRYVRLVTYPEDITEHLIAMGAEFRAARARAGLKQDEVAARFGRSQTYISRREAGLDAFDAVDLLIASRLFNVDIQELASPKPRALSRTA